MKKRFRFLPTSASSTQRLPMDARAELISRRHFLGAAAMGSAGLSLRAAIGGETKREVIVGGCAWVYALGQPNYDITPILDTVFADMEYAGMEGIEVMQTTFRPDNAVERLGALAEKHRMPVIGSSFVGALWDPRRHEAILEEAETVIGRLGKLGGRRLGVSVGAPRGAKERKTAQQFDDQADVLRQLMVICTAHGVVLNLHNHTYEVKDDQYDLRNTLERISDIQLGPDLGWLREAGIDPASFIRQHGKRLVFLHLRDQKADGTWAEAMGEGDTDHVEIAKALREVDFTGYAVIELATPPKRQTRPTRESLKISRQFVRNTMGY
ncbi:MAG: sugar phosphate isomerase/epimerase family protein [Pirellulaceae bacterium]